jgi:hypothetical protein
MKSAAKLSAVISAVLLMIGVLDACGDATSTPAPGAVTFKTIAKPTATLAPFATTQAPTTALITTPKFSTSPMNNNTKMVTTTNSLPTKTKLPLFTSNQEMVNGFKPGPNGNELSLDPALVEAIKAYFNNDSELVIKLFAFNTNSDMDTFPFPNQSYVGIPPKPSKNITGAIFNMIYVQSDWDDKSPDNMPQMAVYQSGMYSQTVQQSIEELNRFSQNHLDTENLLAQLQGRTKIELIVIGKHLLETIQNKRIPEPTLTPLPALAITPSGKPVLIQKNDPLEGDLKIYKLVYDSSRSYTSIRYTMQVQDSNGQTNSVLTYTAIKPRLNEDFEQESDTEMKGGTSQPIRVIIVGGQRYENSYGKGWVQGEYHGLAEGDIVGWGSLYAQFILPSDELAGYNFTLLPDETFKGQMLGHFTLEKPGNTTQVKYEVWYNKQTYKPVQIILSGSSNKPTTIDYEYNNPTWKIEKPTTWVTATPTPTRHY